MRRDETVPHAATFTDQTERDRAIEATYRLDAAALEIVADDLDAMRDEYSTLAAVAANAAALADDFWRTRSTFNAHDLGEALDMWAVRRFGRVLEPAARALIRFEALNRDMKPAGMGWANAWEERTWISAVRKAGGPPKGPLTDGQSLAFVERVAELVAKEPKRMPAMPEAEDMTAPGAQW